MASTVKITLTFGQDEAVLTLLDPLGSDNTWSCDPADFLSTGAGKWSQGIGAESLMLKDDAGMTNVLEFDGLNMYDPHVGQSGDAYVISEDGTVGDRQTVRWIIDSVR